MPEVPSFAERGRLGAYRSWANTPDRTARTRNGRASSPGSIEYWIARLDPAKFAGATDAQKVAAAEMAKKAYFAELGLKAKAAKQAKAAARRAERVA